ncbi:MFS-type transporter SLC18B1 [Nymphon striatum]|nr:MFS-type transporter SLC18B1 [Nymphon striatum]
MEEVEPTLPQHPVKRKEITRKKVLKLVIMCLTILCGGMCFSHIGSFFPPVGVLGMAFGFGISAGLTYGGIVYDNFGFKGPFLGLFVMLLVLWIPAYFVMKKSPEYEQSIMENSKEDDASEDEMISWGKLIKVPEIFVMALCAMIPTMAITNLDVSLTLHVIEKFHVSNSIAGLVMFIGPGIYALSAPLVGFLVDKKDCPATIIGIGSTTSVLGYLLLGPVPFLYIKPSLWIVCFSSVLIGFGIAFMYVPALPLGIKALRCFIGPFTGGFILQTLGFEWTSLVYASLSASVVSDIALLYSLDERDSPPID